MSEPTHEPETHDILTTKQQRRMIAMHSSKELLSLPASAGGVFTSSTSRPAVGTEDYVDAIIQLSDYMLHGTQKAVAEPVRGIGFGFPVPSGFFQHLFGDEPEGEEGTDEVLDDGEAMPAEAEATPDQRTPGEAD